MTHSDDNGTVLSPKLAPIQVVIVPIYRKDDQLSAISDYASGLVAELKAKGVSVKYDDDDSKKPGWKFAEYEMKGVPLRIAIGPRDLENKTVELARRDTLTKETVSQNDIIENITTLLVTIQEELFNRSKNFLSTNRKSS